MTTVKRTESVQVVKHLCKVFFVEVEKCQSLELFCLRTQGRLSGVDGGAGEVIITLTFQNHL
jgi:hypothetical protein